MQFAHEVERAAAMRRARTELSALAEAWGAIEPRPALSRAG
jgi:FMN-dependent NADH-azoreductase